MKQFSTWAAANKWAARMSIFVLYLVLNISGLLVGDLFFLSGLSFSNTFVCAVVIFCIAGLAFYPLKKERSRYKDFYRARKTFDALLITCTFLFVVAIGNGNSFFSVHFNNNSSAAYASTVNNTIEKPGKKLSKKSLLKKLKDNIRQIRKLYDEGSKTEKTLLVILTIIVALLALFGIAALSCNLSCSGSEALALIVGIGGTALIIFLMVRVIKKIYNKPSKKTESEGAAQ